MKDLLSHLSCSVTKLSVCAIVVCHYFLIPRLLENLAISLISYFMD
jgi:hypothetical protein